MDPKYHEGKRSLKEKMMSKGDGIAEEDFDDEVEEEEGGGGGNGGGFIDHDQKKRGAGVGCGKRGSGGSAGGSSIPSCQVEKCGSDLSEAKRYHRRHKVCEVHAKAPAVVVAGMRQRFCQQCSRFHELTEFDETKRSCRRRLQGHNERRRKSAAESSCGEGPSGRKGAGALKESHQCRQADERGRYQTTLPGNSSYKRSQIR